MRGIVPSPWLEILLALAAVISGALIGAERERHEKPAGLRTLMLVCLGSAAFTMISYAFTSTTGDSGRVAAQIVTGIGFLGAGAILHDRSNISGMTTAATIWATAAVGMAAGAGHLVGALALSLLMRTVLTAVQGWEIRHLGGMRAVSIELLFEPDHGKTRIRIERLREVFHATARQMQIESLEDGQVRASIEVHLPRRHLRELLNSLADLPAVKEIHTSNIGGEP
ncbi:MgtC/SapB family protein [Luteolibacter soli]|uniref:MgtC/SapB family protein n=1 Tax=Luteolibacter soli TaxID=3135280 RepID=A0ABU9ARA2_9BACT